MARYWGAGIGGFAVHKYVMDPVSLMELLHNFYNQAEIVRMVKSVVE